MPGAGGPEVDEVLDLTDGFSEGSFTRNPMRRPGQEEETEDGRGPGAGDGKGAPLEGRTAVHQTSNNWDANAAAGPALKVSPTLSIPRCTTSRRGRSENFLMYSLGLVAFIVVVLAGFGTLAAEDSQLQTVQYLGTMLIRSVATDLEWLMVHRA